VKKSQPSKKASLQLAMRNKEKAAIDAILLLGSCSSSEGGSHASCGGSDNEEQSSSSCNKEDKDKKKSLPQQPKQQQQQIQLHYPMPRRPSVVYAHAPSVAGTTTAHHHYSHSFMKPARMM
jgi:hypothetical protein